jgi:hypothetical protein
MRLFVVLSGILWALWIVALLWLVRDGPFVSKVMILDQNHQPIRGCSKEPRASLAKILVVPVVCLLMGLHIVFWRQVMGCAIWMGDHLKGMAAFLIEDAASSGCFAIFFLPLVAALMIWLCLAVCVLLPLLLPPILVYWLAGMLGLGLHIIRLGERQRCPGCGKRSQVIKRDEIHVGGWGDPDTQEGAEFCISEETCECTDCGMIWSYSSEEYEKPH